MRQNGVAPRSQSLIGQSFDGRPEYFQGRPSAAGDVAPDALLASGSGLDRDTSPEYAEQQVSRIARERGLPESVVRSLVDTFTDGRVLGFLSEPHVNVLLLNLALDRASGQAD